MFLPDGIISLFRQFYGRLIFAFFFHFPQIYFTTISSAASLYHHLIMNSTVLPPRGGAHAAMSRIVCWRAALARTDGPYDSVTVRATATLSRAVVVTPPRRCRRDRRD